MRGVVVALGMAAFFAGANASADANANAGRVVAMRVMTALDDARGCTPLAGGGFAVATGGGLAVIARDGKVRALTSIDGLPETRVHAVVEQRDGVWIGTEGGAAFVSTTGSDAPKVVRTALTAPVQAVHVSPGGAVYLGTRGAGVYRLAARDSAPQLLRTSVKGTRVAAMAEKDGTLYVAYADGPLAKLTSGILVGVDRSPSHGQALASVGGELLLGDLEGLFKVDTTGVMSIASVDARGLAANGAQVMVATWGSGLMTGTTRGALRAEASIPKMARAVSVLGAARCVATTDGVFVDEGKGTFHKIALGGPSSNDVTALAPDATGRRVAVGTFDSGASIYEGAALARVPGLERNETISAMAWQGDKLWVGTAHGLVRVNADGSAKRFTSHDGLPHSYTRAVHVLSTGRVLVGTDAGPAFVDGERVTPLFPFKKDAAVPIASPMHAVWALASAADETLFIGTAAGLYHGKDGRFERASLASGELEDDWVTALAVDGNDVYVGTYAKGVTRLAFGDVTTTKKPVATHLGGGYVNTDGLVVSNGTIYVATMDHLLSRAKSDDTAKWTSQPNAAPGRDVTQVRFVGSETWVASRRGIGIAR